MKYITIRTWQIKCEHLSSWHRYFAWFPVTVECLPDGAQRRIWLEWVQRKGHGLKFMGGYKWFWIYRQDRRVVTGGIIQERFYVYTGKAINTTILMGLAKETQDSL